MKTGIDKHYELSDGIRKLAEASGYIFSDLSIDIANKPESEINILREGAKQIGRDIGNIPLVLRDGDMLAVFSRRM